MRVIIPAYRAGSFLPSCLCALMVSTCARDLEVVVVDDGENGDLESLCASYPAVRIVRGPRTGNAGAARNRGIEGSSDEEILVFVDADVEVEPNALAELMAPIKTGLAEASFGCYSRNVEGLSFAQQYKQLYLWRIYSRHDGYVVNYFWTALSAIKKSTFREAGGFRRCVSNMINEDTELGTNITRIGQRIMAVPRANGRHLKPYTVPEILANDFRKGVSSVRLFLCREGVRLTHNLHSSSEDIRAVFLAGLMLCIVPALRLMGAQGAVTALICVGTVLMYVHFRRNMLAIYRGSGVRFLLKSASLVFVLDVTRGVCVIVGGIELLVGRVMGRANAP